MRLIRSLLAGAAVCASAGAAFAEDSLILSSVDVNGDGHYSYTEMVAAYPGFTAEAFGKVDTSGDGLVDEAELKVATDAALLPKAE